MNERVKMRPHIKTEVLKALRSGKYNQYHGGLRGGACSFCLIGVVCDVLSKVDQKNFYWEELPTRYVFHSRANGRTCVAIPIPDITQAVFEFTNTPSRYESRDAWSLKHNGWRQFMWDLNDSQMLSFEQLADLIEQQL